VSKPTRPCDKELVALVERAQKGDKAALPGLRGLLQDPAAVDALGGDLARQAQLVLIDKFGGQNLLVKEALTRKLDLLRAELAGSDPTPLERLLVERVVACWLHLHHLEITYAGRESMSLELGAYYQRSLSAAHKRYLSALKTLAQVRKLAVPVLQVNIARKQVNVAGVCPAAEGEAGASASSVAAPPRRKVRAAEAPAPVGAPPATALSAPPAPARGEARKPAVQGAAVVVRGQALSEATILAYADQYHRLTGWWPVAASGTVSGPHGVPDLSWEDIDEALRARPALPLGDSLRALLARTGRCR
jgi:hypothetical protein